MEALALCDEGLTSCARPVISPGRPGAQFVGNWRDARDYHKAKAVYEECMAQPEIGDLLRDR
jgi:hypothetical protein